MSEPQASLEALRSAGAWRLDPARFHFLEALARRLAGQPEAVRRLLQQKLQAGVANYAERVAQEQQGVASKPTAKPRAVCAPLAELNQSLRKEPGELASVRRFRRAWSSSRSLDQVAQAASRKPANAGPLNSHVLVLDALALMGELSPDYLRRFLVQVESLQWLDAKAAKPVATVRRARQKK
jgi:hypothetical protein